MALKVTSLPRIRVLLIIAGAFAVLATSFWLGTRNLGYHGAAVSSRENEKATGSALETPSPLSQVPALSPVPTTTSTPTAGEMEDNQTNKEPALSGSFVGTLNLIIPVAGVGPEKLRDTFTDARSEGRVHDAIDIMAPAGTPVLAASDGEIVRLFQSDRGGTTIYQLSADKKLVFYYAHLQRYTEGLAVGKFARQGEVIAYVGDTGNAGAGNYHLHFSIAVLTDPKRYWEGTNINPYSLLRK